MGEYIRRQCSVGNSEKVRFRSASGVLCSLRTDNKDVCLPSQVLGAWNLVRLLNYDSGRCLYCCTSRKQTEVPRSCFSVVAANAQLFYLLLHLEVLVSSSYSICSIYFSLTKGSSGCTRAGHKATLHRASLFVFRVLQIQPQFCSRRSQ